MLVEILNDDIDFSAYLLETDHKTLVRPATDFINAAKNQFLSRLKEKRTYLPWPKCNPHFDFRSGEVTLYAGQNGHGKTDVTTQVALSLVGQDEKVCVASFEMKPITTIGRMVRMYAGNNASQAGSPDSDAQLSENGIYEEFGDWVHGRLWLYDQTGTARPDTVLGMVKYCAHELGVRHVFIDSLMKCVRGDDDYDGQKQFVDQLCALARDCDVHVHLVHHLRKPTKEGDFPDKHDTKGSGSITDQVDNIFMVWRNKPKEEAFRASGTKSSKQSEPDAYLACKKQRNYAGTLDGEPLVSLWRHRNSGQFVGEPDGDALFFPNYPHVPTLALERK